MWYLIVFFISMVPIVEIRGAVPVAVANDLNLFWTYVICILGNMLPSSDYLPLCKKGSCLGF